MTIIGAWIPVAGDRGLLWADTEGFRRDRETRRIERSIGHALKMAINERCSLAAAGAGDVGGNMWIAETVAQAHSFDDFCLRLPTKLREEATERYDAIRRYPDWICIAVGYSRRFGQVMGAVCSAASNFALSITRSFTAPRLPDGWEFSIAGTLDLLPLAKLQLRTFADYPFDGGNKLIVADVRRDRASISRAFDLTIGFDLAAPPKLPAMAEWRAQRIGGGGA